MRLEIIVGALMLIAPAGIGLYLRVQRARILSLKWPKRMGYHAFNHAVDTYLKYHGWSINNMFIAQHKKIVRRANDRVRIYCHANGAEISRSLVKDMSDEAVSSKPELLVCITSHAVDPHLTATAASGRVIIVPYGRLDIFGNNKTGQFATFDALRRTLAEK